MSVLLLHHQLHYEQCTVQMSFSHNSLVLIQMIIRHLLSHKSVCLDNDESDITAELKLFRHLRVGQLNHLEIKNNNRRGTTRSFI